MDLRKTISSSKNWLDLKAKIDACSNTKDKGDIFELLTKLYLSIAPEYASKLKSVWLYHEVPTNLLKKLNLPTRDMGIDLIAETKSGEYWAVQCKYKSDESNSLTWREISTFQSLAFAKAKGITFGLIATTADRASSLFKEQKENVKLLSGDIWNALDEGFFQDAKALLSSGKVPLPKPYDPHPHQKRAIEHAYKHYILNKESRGKMIMPCGAGKSLTAYWIAKELKSKTILVAVPSLSLISQTLKAWTREVVANKQTVDWIAVCSDSSVGETDVAIYTQDLGVPTTTDPEFISRWLRKRSQGLKVVFTTYQSGKVLAEASRSAKRVFDLGIMDEAHKTVGDREKTFAHLLFDENVKIRKRVFMTATERRYAGSRDEILSMDDHAVYGDTFELLSFKEALEQKEPILSDYKILTISICKDDIAQYVEQRSVVKPDRGKWDDGVQAEMLAGVVALHQAMEKYPIKHAVSFHTSIAKAKAFQENQQLYSDEVNAEPNSLETYFVSGKTPTSIRSRKIQEFADSEKALISNARCLTEGVDVPKIDGVLFADPKRSTIDIVQAVGRALRTADDKEYGYIIIPVLIEDEDDFEKGGAFQTILTVLRALASNDERIVEYFRERSTSASSNGIIEHLGSDQLLERVNLEEFVESIELQVWSRLAKLSWRSFEDARIYVRSLGLQNVPEWTRYHKNGQIPYDIPSSPNEIYKGSGWISFGDWLGTGNIATRLKQYRPFEEARDFVRSLGLKNQAEWNEYGKSELCPDDIPSTPNGTYRGNGWVSMGDWIGTGTEASQFKMYRPFEEARDFVTSLGLKNQAEWREYCISGLLPEDISANPHRTYKNDGWNGIGDWLGTGAVSNQLRQFRPFEEARDYARSLGLKNRAEWREYCKSDLFPDYIPAKPEKTYGNRGWIGFGDWLGTGNVAPHLRQFRPFEEARDFVRSLGLKNQAEWNEYGKSELCPDDIPSTPNGTYRGNGWVSMGDWIGTGTEASQFKMYRPFEEARDFVTSLGLKNQAEWREYCISGLLPEDISANPHRTYKNDGWNGIGDWLGTGKIANQLRQFRPFEEARDYARSLGLKGQDEWKKYCLSGMVPDDIPFTIWRLYKEKGWISWPDFLGYEPKGKMKK